MPSLPVNEIAGVIESHNDYDHAAQLINGVDAACV